MKKAFITFLMIAVSLSVFLCAYTVFNSSHSHEAHAVDAHIGHAHSLTLAVIASITVIAAAFFGFDQADLFVTPALQSIFILFRVDEAQPYKKKRRFYFNLRSPPVQ